MNTLLSILEVASQIAVLLALGAIIVLRESLFSYSRQKGKNLATKEDIAEITKRVEGVKSEYHHDLEEIKAQLALRLEKRGALLDEKIRVFKRLQNRLVTFKRYVDACIGSMEYGGEFRPNLDSLPEDIERSALLHLTALREIMQEDFIFLSVESRQILDDLLQNLSMMASIELTTTTDEALFRNTGTLKYYQTAEQQIDDALENLYFDLRSPTTEQDL